MTISIWLVFLLTALWVIPEIHEAGNSLSESRRNEAKRLEDLEKVRKVLVRGEVQLLNNQQEALRRARELLDLFRLKAHDDVKENKP